MMADLTSLTGDHNFVGLPGLGVENLYLKLEHLNPSGSIKFKTALGLIGSCEDAGIIRNDTILIESSSGNLGVALSVICAARGYSFTCVVDPNVNAQNVERMKALGTNVVRITEEDENGGFLGTRLAYIRGLLASDSRYHWLNQYENPANAAIHAKTTAKAIDVAFDRLDYLFVGVGTAGTLMGCIQRFARTRPHLKIVAVDSAGSVTFGLPPGKRYIPGLGSSQPPKIFRPDGLHALVTVPEEAAVATCRHLACRSGILAGGSTGTVLSAVQAWRDRFTASDVVVAIAPDGGTPYLGTIYDDAWVSERLGPEALAAWPENPALARCVTVTPRIIDTKEAQHA
ncbi:2,3-diaminopropionate biosynthesis protein SbnA [Arenibaculum sp.]|uniref:2,3-diaminopropionate biosynthesis protein SbnA n=1 Tax=Arenibaculum sp. TaxID=2865862 RepID=UPI002E0F76DD|nr:2,3-diaminopropionate biosynthesis protein SbnA [Arenibaculum sp.]